MILQYVFVLFLTKDFMLRVNGSVQSSFNRYNHTNQLHKANVEQAQKNFGRKKETSKRKNARILNVAVPSEENYPWLAGIIKITESNVPGKTVEGYCTGALITKRNILTAAHCLCYYDDEIDKNETPEKIPKARCKHPKTGENPPLNQIQHESPFNKIFYIHGVEEDDDDERKLPKFDLKRVKEDNCLAYVLKDNWNLAEMAFVYHTELNDKKQVVLGKGNDIGLITLPPNPENPGVPIALPETIKDMDKEAAKIAGWGRRFTFGKHPDGSIGSVDKPTALSSCMTSEKGPLDTRFKHCDTTKLIGSNDGEGGCNIDFEDIPEFTEECSNIWSKIETDLAGGDLEELFNQVDRIRILAPAESPDETPEMECYNEMNHLYKWCEIVPDEGSTPPRKKMWGFCSPSCGFIKEDELGEGPLDEHQFGYYDLDITIIEGRESRIWQVCDIEEERLSESEICLSIERPSSETWEFQRKGDNEFEFKRKIVEDAPMKNHLYSASAGGDSGAPVWITKNGKQEIVAVHWGKMPRDPDDVDSLFGNLFSTDAVLIAVKLDEKVLNWIQKHMIRDTKRPRDLDDDLSEND